MLKRIPYVCAVITVAIILGGCAHTGRQNTRLGWPPPPNDPKVIYLESVYGSHNLKRSFFGKVKDFLFGRSTDMDIAKPYGLVNDGSRRLYIADTGRKGILIFDFGSGTVRFFRDLGPYGKLGEPVNVILDDARNVYVADTKLGRVVVFDREGRFLRFIGNEGDLTSPVGMAISERRGEIYIVDSKEHLVKRYTLAGDYVGSFGRRGDAEGEFYHPLGIALSDGDTLYIVDSFHFAVQAFDLDGHYLFSFGHRPDGVGTMARPRAIAIDSDGNLYVTDALNNNVQMYDRTGQLLLRMGGVGLGAGQFRLPAGICITDDDAIFIADSINRRIQKFRYLAER